MNIKQTIIATAALILGLVIVTACGGGSKSNESAETDGQQTEESAETTQTAEPEKTEQKSEQKVEAKKWYEGDFMLAEKLYVGGNSRTRIYARKGNIIIGTMEGSSTTTLFVCTDSTRTEYLVSNTKKAFAKKGEKSGFTSVDDAIYKYLKGQMSGSLFGKRLKKDDKDCTVRDTVIFDRPAYIITKEATEKNSTIEVWAKTVMYIDKANSLPYYKWSIMKTNGEVYAEGKAFEITSFSDHPTYEGLIVSLDGLTEIQ